MRAETDRGQRRGQRAVRVESEGLRAADEVAVNGEVRFPLQRPDVAEEHRAGVRLAERVEGRQRGRVVEGVRIARVEGQGREVCRRRAEVQRGADQRSGLRRRLRGVQLQVTEHAGAEGRAGRVRRRVGLQPLAGRVDHVAGAVHLEGPGAAVHLAARVAEHEETLAVERQVEVVAGEIDVALGELLRHRGKPHAGTDGILRDAAVGQRKDVGELGARLLEADGGGVGDVVARDAKVGGGGVQAAQGGSERHVPVLLLAAVNSARLLVCGLLADLADLAQVHDAQPGHSQ